MKRFSQKVFNSSKSCLSLLTFSYCERSSSSPPAATPRRSTRSPAGRRSAVPSCLRLYRFRHSFCSWRVSFDVKSLPTSDGLLLIGENTKRPILNLKLHGWGAWIAEWSLHSTFEHWYALPWAMSLPLVTTTLFRTQAQHLCIIS